MKWLMCLVCLSVTVSTGTKAQASTSFGDSITLTDLATENSDLAF